MIHITYDSNSRCYIFHHKCDKCGWIDAEIGFITQHDTTQLLVTSKFDTSDGHQAIARFFANYLVGLPYLKCIYCDHEPGHETCSYASTSTGIIHQVHFKFVPIIQAEVRNVCTFGIDAYGRLLQTCSLCYETEDVADLAPETQGLKLDAGLFAALPSWCAKCKIPFNYYQARKSSNGPPAFTPPLPFTFEAFEEAQATLYAETYPGYSVEFYAYKSGDVIKSSAFGAVLEFEIDKISSNINKHLNESTTLLKFLK